MENIKQDELYGLLKSDGQPIVLVEGKAGSGKTYGTSQVITRLGYSDDEVLLVAPSHTAKDNLFFSIYKSNNIAYSACTTAALLNKIPSISYKAKKEVFVRTSDLPKDQLLSNKRLVIIDECFMLSERDIIDILESLEGFNCGVLFLGDRNQLLPVKGASPAKFFDLSENIDKIYLDKVFRQSGDLLTACNKIMTSLGGMSSIRRIKRKLKGLENVNVIDLGLEEGTITGHLEDIYQDEQYTIISYTNKQVIQHNLDIDSNKGWFKKGQEILLYNNMYESYGCDTILDYWEEWSNAKKAEPIARNSEKLKIIDIGVVESDNLLTSYFSDLVKVNHLNVEYQKAVVQNSGGARFETILLNYSSKNPFQDLANEAIVKLSEYLKDAIVTRGSKEYKHHHRDNYKLLNFVNHGCRPSNCMTVHKSQGQTIENVAIDLTKLPFSNLDNYIYTAVTRASKTLTLIGY